MTDKEICKEIKSIAEQLLQLSDAFSADEIESSLINFLELDETVN